MGRERRRYELGYWCMGQLEVIKRGGKK